MLLNRSLYQCSREVSDTSDYITYSTASTELYMYLYQLEEFLLSTSFFDVQQSAQEAHWDQSWEWSPVSNQ